MKFCVTDFWISKLHMTGVSKFLAIKFVGKFFSFFRVGFERNLDQILKIVKIEIANIKCHTWGRSKNFSLFFSYSIFLYKSTLYLYTDID